MAVAAVGRTPEEVAAKLDVCRASLYRTEATGIRCQRLQAGAYEATIVDPELYRRFRERQARRTAKGRPRSPAAPPAGVPSGPQESPEKETPNGLAKKGANAGQYAAPPPSGSPPYLGQLRLDMDLNERENAHLIGHLNAQANMYELVREQMVMMESGLAAMKEQMALVQLLLDRLPHRESA